MTLALSRRKLLATGFVIASANLLPGNATTAAGRERFPARMRVIVDNDFAGDPDGLFQLAHFSQCDSVSIPFVVGTHYKDFAAADLIPRKGMASADKARELLRFLPRTRRPLVLAGEDRPLQSRAISHTSSATSAIVQEAMRNDVSNPLYYSAGGSLTEIALAWIAEPKIGRRLRLLWIGGAEHPDLAAPPPGAGEAEYNFSLDRLAAQIIFNESDIEIWQVPRNAFRQMLFSAGELDVLGRSGPVGKYLKQQVVQTNHRLSANLPSAIFSEGEAIGLGDSALVTLTALQSAFQPDSSSSSYAIRPTPTLQADGNYTSKPAGRPMRVYTSIDSSLTFRDMLAKLQRR